MARPVVGKTSLVKPQPAASPNLSERSRRPRLMPPLLLNRQHHVLQLLVEHSYM